MKKIDYSKLPIEEQIKKHKKILNFTIIFGSIWVSFWLIASIILFWHVDWQLALAILITTCITAFGGGLEIYYHINRLKALQKSEDKKDEK